MKTSITAVAAIAMLGATPFTRAATPLGDHFSFSAFGTLGAVVTNSDEGQYIREFQAKGATKSPSALVDSNLGLQITGKANDWLSGTVQTLTAQRTEDRLSTRVEWAFVKVAPVEGLALRAGRFSLPTFLISDSRRVGYANTTLRPADDVYGLDLLNGGLKGVDASYRLPIGGNSLTVTGSFGKSSYTNPRESFAFLKMNKVSGLNMVWDGDWYTLRLGYVEAEPEFPAEFAAFLPPGTSLSDKYTFTGIGLSVDKNNVVLQGEYVQRRSKNFNQGVGADAWYMMGGYRMGPVLPYLQFSRRTPTSDAMDSVFPQSTKVVGLRWDAFASAAVKFQLERVDTKGTSGASFVTPVVDTPFGPIPAAVTKPVTTFSVAVDFVF